jgi:hypothetical protein
MTWYELNAPSPSARPDESDAAKRFLERMPTPEGLMPAVTVAQLESLSGGATAMQRSLQAGECAMSGS